MMGGLGSVINRADALNDFKHLLHYGIVLLPNRSKSFIVRGDIGTCLCKESGEKIVFIGGAKARYLISPFDAVAALGEKLLLGSKTYIPLVAEHLHISTEITWSPYGIA